MRTVSKAGKGDALEFYKACADQSNPFSRQLMVEKVFTSIKLAAVSRVVMSACPMRFRMSPELVSKEMERNSSWVSSLSRSVLSLCACAEIMAGTGQFCGSVYKPPPQSGAP